MKVAVIFLFVLVAVSCEERKQSETDGSTDKSDIQFKRGVFGYDKVFLQENYKNTLVLESEDKQAMVVLSPELQGRVMTSTLNGDKGESFGWLNYDLISSKKIVFYYFSQR